MKPGWHVRLHPDALSPDPTYGTPAPPGEGIEYFEDVFPWELVRCTPSQPAADAWGERLDGDRCPPELELSAASNGASTWSSTSAPRSRPPWNWPSN